LDQGKLSTNLLPPEIATDRMIREKKPWAVAMVAVLLLGIALNFFGYWRAWNSVHDSYFKGAMSTADSASSTASSGKSNYDSAKAAFTQISDVGQGLVGNVDGRRLWLELLTAVNQCLPSDPKDQPRPKIADRNELHITSLECEKYADLSTWYQAGISKRIEEAKIAMAPQAPPAAPAGAAPADGGVAPPAEGAAPPADGAAPPPADAAAAPGAPGVDPAAGAVPGQPGQPGAQPGAPGAGEATPDAGPTGPGWVIELRGYHFHNEGLENNSAAFVRQTLINNLRTQKIKLADKDGNLVEVPIAELGISHPVITSDLSTPRPYPMRDPDDEAKEIKLLRWDFRVQFAWSPTPLSKREELKKQKAEGTQGDALAGGAAGGQ
jgi:type IV pilus assembly protein PilM